MNSLNLQDILLPLACQVDYMWIPSAKQQYLANENHAFAETASCSPGISRNCKKDDWLGFIFPPDTSF